MTTPPPSPHRRRLRLQRDESPPEDLIFVLRAVGSDLQGVVDDIVRDARDSASIYDIEIEAGNREALFGVSVFALRTGRSVGQVLERFTASPSYLAVNLGSLRRIGLDVIATGTNVDHYDIQLIRGLPADRANSVTTDELRGIATRVLALAEPPRPNPAYDENIRNEPEDPR